MPDPFSPFGPSHPALATLYPDIPVKVSKRPAAGSKNMEGGWQSGFPVPCLVVSSLDPEDIDRVPSFTTVSVGHPVLIEYVKAAQAAVAFL